MQTISVSKFKATCLAAVRRVWKTRKPLRITWFGKPVADLIPTPPETNTGSWIGAFQGTGRIVGDVVSPASDEEDWEVLRS